MISHKAIKNTQSTISPNSTTVTMISCNNAAGSTPYYVFKGKLENKDLLKGAVPGSAHTETGWSNGDIIKF